MTSKDRYSILKNEESGLFTDLLICLKRAFYFVYFYKKKRCLHHWIRFFLLYCVFFVKIPFLIKGHSSDLTIAVKR